MLLQVSCAFLFFYRTGCFLELKLRVLLVSFLYSGLQSIHIHMVTTLNNMRHACFMLYTREPENMVLFVCIFCSDIYVTGLE